MKIDVSVIINTKNAAKTLKRALDSVKQAQEIVIVDMHSDDDTIAIAKKYTSKIFKHADVGYVEPARNFAIQKATQDWVLLLDADEEFQPALLEKVKSLIETKSDVTCYYIPRKNIIFGKWVEKTGWWPDYQPRLFKKDAVVWKDEVHSPPVITGNSEYLPVNSELAIIHHNYDSVSDYLQRLDRYTTISSKEDFTDKSKISGAELVKSFSDELLRRLFLDKGLDEGVHGVGLSFLQSMYQLVIQLKKWELQSTKDAAGSVSATIKQVTEFKKDLAYWIADYHVQHSSGFSQMVWRFRKKLKI